jgi:hypothetical protein
MHISYNEKVNYGFNVQGVSGCCGLCAVYGFYVRNDRDDVITKEEYDALDHIDFIKHVQDSFVSNVESARFSRMIITDVVPSEITNVDAAYYDSRAKHNEAINLYTILTDLGWKKLGAMFKNKKTNNVVASFYKDV